MTNLMGFAIFYLILGLKMLKKGLMYKTQDHQCNAKKLGIYLFSQCFPKFCRHIFLRKNDTQEERGEYMDIMENVEA